MSSNTLAKHSRVTTSALVLTSPAPKARKIGTMEASGKRAASARAACRELPVPEKV
jgi:hypothetical protein